MKVFRTIGSLLRPFYNALRPEPHPIDEGYVGEENSDYVEPTKEQRDDLTRKLRLRSRPINPINFKNPEPPEEEEGLIAKIGPTFITSEMGGRVHHGGRLVITNSSTGERFTYGGNEHSSAKVYDRGDMIEIVSEGERRIIPKVLAQIETLEK